MEAILQNAATTGNGTAVDLSVAGAMRCELIAYLEGSAGISAGAVQLEEAASADYAGTWSAIGSPVTLAASTVKVVRQTGTFKAVRARISTDVVGGTVTVRLVVGESPIA